MSTKKIVKKKPAVKKAAPKSVTPKPRAIVRAFDALLKEDEPRVRIGSIVEYKDKTVAVIMWYDESEHERASGKPEMDWYKWGGVRLDKTNYEEGLWVTERMIETGEAKIIGHFDIYSLVNGNLNR